MSKKDFCCVGDFPVLIPYRDLEKVVEVANNMDRYQRELHRTSQQLAALRTQYTELLEKVRKMEQIL